MWREGWFWCRSMLQIIKPLSKCTTIAFSGIAIAWIGWVGCGSLSKNSERDFLDSRVHICASLVALKILNTRRTVVFAAIALTFCFFLSFSTSWE